MASRVAWAQLNVEHNTVVTFTAPVEVPGARPQVLPAGKYTFKVIDSKSNPNIVQISNEDETHVYTTVLAIPIRRELDTDDTVMTFEERPKGQPQALRAWFYPHEKVGQEFVYSKDHAAELAKSFSSPTPANESANLKAAVPTVSALPVTAPTVSASPVTAVTPAPVLQSPPAAQSVQSAPDTQQAQATSTTPDPIRPSPAQPTNNLPQTASNLPTVGLVGCLFVVVGFSIRKLCEL
jgi:hypothetical protein